MPGSLNKWVSKHKVNSLLETELILFVLLTCLDVMSESSKEEVISLLHLRISELHRCRSVSLLSLILLCDLGSLQRLSVVADRSDNLFCEGSHGVIELGSYKIK